MWWGWRRSLEGGLVGGYRMSEMYRGRLHVPRKTTNRVPASIISPKVGHAPIPKVFGLDLGTNAYCFIRVDVNAASNMLMSKLSPFVNSKVTTSFGFLSSHVFTSLKYHVRGPASSR